MSDTYLGSKKFPVNNLILVRGSQGFNGLAGVMGAMGYPGDNYTVNGNTGSKGYQGTTGTTGSQGYQGTTGTTGSQGYQGTTGVQGYQGNTGIQGYQGNTGVQGYQGSVGNIGVQGINGDIGRIGRTGLQGIIGDTGIIGSIGTGVQGIIGATGVNQIGPQGMAGNTFTYPTSYIEGNIPTTLQPTITGLGEFCSVSVPAGTWLWTCRIGIIPTTNQLTITNVTATIMINGITESPLGISYETNFSTGNQIVVPINTPCSFYTVSRILTFTATTTTVGFRTNIVTVGGVASGGYINTSGATGTGLSYFIFARLSS